MKQLTYRKKEAIQIVTKAAKDYKRLLENQNFLFIYRNRSSNQIEYFETLFTARNFQHLTGIQLLSENGSLITNHIQFYQKCIDNKLSESEIHFKPDGTTPLKLYALPQIIHFLKSSKMTAIYHDIRPKLTIDRLVGTTGFCLGFTYDKRGYYMPSSALLEDIRKLAGESHQILAVLSKTASKEIPLYRTIRHTAKGINLENLLLPPDLHALLETNACLRQVTPQTGSPPGTPASTPPRPAQSETPSS